MLEAVEQHWDPSKKLLFFLLAFDVPLSSFFLHPIPRQCVFALFQGIFNVTWGLLAAIHPGIPGCARNFFPTGRLFLHELETTREREREKTRDLIRPVFMHARFQIPPDRGIKPRAGRQHVIDVSRDYSLLSSSCLVFTKGEMERARAFHSPGRRKRKSLITTWEYLYAEQIWRNYQWRIFFFLRDSSCYLIDRNCSF